MKNDEKYAWRVGSSPPELQQHSTVKHKIIESYVHDYIRTLMSRAIIPRLQLTLVDGFSGGGCYRGETGDIVDGSPLLMMKAVKEARAELNLGREISREVDVDYEFIDICQETVDHLEYWLRARTEEGRVDPLDAQRANLKCGDFLTEIPRLIETIKQRKMGERSIFVLDQYNYYDLPLPQIAHILQSLKGAEVILTFNVGALITFLSDHAANRKPLEHIGLDRYIPWESIRRIKAEERQTWRRNLQRHLAYGIRRETKAAFATLFFVKPFGVNSWDYWLIHLSNHYRAHDVMKDLHWRYSTEFGHELEPGVFIQGYDANEDSLYTGQSTFDFSGTSRIACVDGVREHFGKVVYDRKRPIQLGQLFQEWASYSPGAERHFIEATGALHRSKEIVVVGADGRIRRPSKHYGLDDVIEYSPQIRLIY